MVRDRLCAWGLNIKNARCRQGQIVQRIQSAAAATSSHPPDPAPEERPKLLLSFEVGRWYEKLYEEGLFQAQAWSAHSPLADLTEGISRALRTLVLTGDSAAYAQLRWWGPRAEQILRQEHAIAPLYLIRILLLWSQPQHIEAQAVAQEVTKYLARCVASLDIYGPFHPLTRLLGTMFMRKVDRGMFWDLFRLVLTRGSEHNNAVDAADLYFRIRMMLGSALVDECRYLTLGRIAESERSDSGPFGYASLVHSLENFSLHQKEQQQESAELIDDMWPSEQDIKSSVAPPEMWALKAQAGTQFQRGDIEDSAASFREALTTITGRHEPEVECRRQCILHVLYEIYLLQQKLDKAKELKDLYPWHLKHS